MCTSTCHNPAAVSSKIERLEPLAAAVNVAYTVLYLQESVAAFPVAAAGAGLFGWICWKKGMLAETALWAFYVAFAGYGWMTTSAGWPAPVVHAWWAHALSVAGIAFGSWLLTGALKRLGERTAVGWDAFTTVSSLVATGWMLAFDPINWWYWMVINAASVVLYLRNGLRWGAALFTLYTLLAVEGWFDLFNWI